jgi:LysM repeat protein
LALVALFSVALFVQLGSVSPTRWILRQVDRATAFVSAIGEQLQPNLTVTLQPSAEEESAELLSQPQIPPLSNALDQPEGSATQQGEFENTSFAQGNDEGTTSGNEAAVEAAETSSPAGEETPSETPTEAPTATPTDEPTPTTEPTFTPEPTPTAVSANLTSTRVLTPTSSTPTVTSTLPAGNQFTVQPLVAASAATATATATQSITTTSTPFLALLLPTPTPPAPTPTPNIYIIRAGDTLFEIAMANGVSLSALLAANGLTEDDVYTIQPGDRIIIPDPNAPIESTATPTATPTPIQGGFTYTVQPGDTLMAIGMRFGVNLQRILDANNLTLAQARTLRPGQQLIIPGDAPPGSPTPTVVPVAPSPTPATAAASIRLDAPVLRTPENRVSVKCGAGEQLVWNPVASIQPTDLYLVHLGYVNGRTADGGEQIVWVIQQQRPANVTLWQLDDTLCGLAPLELGRQWRWYVEVVERGPDGTLRSVSPPSEMWGFTWQ